MTAGGVGGEAVDLGVDGLGPGVRVGAGGFGAVYRAVQRGSGGDVAVKMLHIHLEADAAVRFQREAKALGALRGHPNICTVYDAGFNRDRRPYLVMEYAPETLATRLRQHGAASWSDVLAVGVKLAGALETAHRAHLLHRDVKPANVLVTRYGEPRLSDFGLARSTDDEVSRSVLTGTVAHMAPELFADSPESVASDVYALGSTLFELLAGAPAFSGSPSAAMHAILNDRVPDLRARAIPGPVAAVIERAMAKDPADRYPTAQAVGNALRDAQTQLGLTPTDLPLATTAASTAADLADGHVDDTEPETAPHARTPTDKLAHGDDQLSVVFQRRQQPLTDPGPDPNQQDQDDEETTERRRFRPVHGIAAAVMTVVLLALMQFAGVQVRAYGYAPALIAATIIALVLGFACVRLFP